MTTTQLAKKLLVAALVAMATPAAAQVVTSPITLRDSNGDGIIRLDASAAKVTPPQKRGTIVVPCVGFPKTYAVQGTPCPVVTPPAEPQQPAPVDRYAFLNTGKFSGPNVSGLEFKTELSIKTADLDFYIDQGATSLRIPFKFERIFASPEKLAAFKSLILHGANRGVLMIADEHGYDSVASPRVLNGWLRLAPEFKGNPLVAFDLQNEPKGRFTTWGGDMRGLIHAVRRSGADNLLLAEWVGYSAAYRADKREPANKPCESALCSLNRAGVYTLADLDPLKRTWLSAHQYPDKDGSGTNANCVSTVSAAGAMRGPIALAKALGARVHIGETAFGRNSLLPSSCKTFAYALVELVKATPEIAGVNLWGGGPRWAHSYYYRIENPSNRPATWSTEHGKLVRETWATAK